MDLSKLSRKPEVQATTFAKKSTATSFKVADVMYRLGAAHEVFAMAKQVAR